MRISVFKRHFFFYLAIVILFSSWIVFYTIPRVWQYPIFFIPSLAIILYLYYPYAVKNVKYFLLFGIVLIRFAIPTESDFTISNYIASIVRYLLLASFFLINKKDLKVIYNNLITILIVILSISLFFYLLKVSGIYSMDPITTWGAEGEGERTWNVYWFFSFQDNPNKGEIIRFASIFDEPGYLGTMLAFILAIENFNVRPNRNKLFLFCGIITFSLAFYMLSLLYLTFSTHIKVKYKLYALSVVAVLLALSSIFLQDILTDNIYNRLIGEDDDIVLVDNQRVGLDKQKEIFEVLSLVNTKALFWGAGLNAHNEYDLGVNWSRLIFQLGIVFTLLFISTIILYSYGSRNTITFALVFIISLMQRPEVFAPIWFFLLLYGTTKYNTMNQNLKPHFIKN